MNCITVSSSEWTYPDITGYKTGGRTINCHAARGGRLCCQILLTGVGDGGGICCEADGGIAGFELEFYEMVPIFVDKPGLETYNPVPLYPNRTGPFYIYDCLKPLGGRIKAMDQTAALYICARVPEDFAAGVYEGGLVISLEGEKTKIPASFTVHKAVLPSETLKFATWYNPRCTAKYHNAEPGSGEYERLDLLYHKMMRRMHMNTLRVDIGADILQTGENKYEFDFSKFERYVKMGIAEGFKYFQTPSIGGRRSWSQPTIYVNHGEIPCLSYEGYAYLSQYLGEFGKLLKENGWTDMFYFSIADEPNDINALEYRALCGMVRHLLPGVKLFDAMSHVPVYGSLDVYVPLNSEYEKHIETFERFRGSGDELWHYVCCGPRGEGYINRFMDYPLLATRYLFWGNYKYNLTGYLHWAVNQYQTDQDPFTNNWPLHWNAGNSCILPPGDTHIIYPGEGAPWMSMRLEAHRESAEEYEILRSIAQKDKEAADRLCALCFAGFNKVENDPAKFDEARIEMFETLGKLQGF
ncbi:MAG: DUF4091 domain-containing protein [Oscillospiraceae bacterium]|nr:DUF4091 domain-containing protein [Oscillospiraceae bacterium]